jgi:hypothetical protein
VIPLPISPAPSTHTFLIAIISFLLFLSVMLLTGGAAVRTGKL